MSALSLLRILAPAGIVACMAVAVLAACFTEVGNPGGETGMTARIRVDGSTAPPGADEAATEPDSVLIAAFGLRFLGASYRGPDSADRALWQARNGADLDFAGGDSLPRAKLDNPPALEAGVRLGASPAAKFIRGAYRLGGITRSFRFAIPDTTEFSLRYDSAALEAWRTNGSYDCHFIFFARLWLSVPGLDTAAVFPNGAGGDTVFFDADRNPELHQALAQRLSHAFNGPAAYPKKAGIP